MPFSNLRCVAQASKSVPRAEQEGQDNRQTDGQVNLVQTGWQPSIPRRNCTSFESKHSLNFACVGMGCGRWAQPPCRLGVDSRLSEPGVGGPCLLLPKPVVDPLMPDYASTMRLHQASTLSQTFCLEFQQSSSPLVLTRVQSALLTLGIVTKGQCFLDFGAKYGSFDLYELPSVVQPGLTRAEDLCVAFRPPSATHLLSWPQTRQITGNRAWQTRLERVAQPCHWCVDP